MEPESRRTGQDFGKALLETVLGLKCRRGRERRGWGVMLTWAVSVFVSGRKI